MSGAAIIIKEKRTMRAFAEAGATSARSARTLEELGLRDSWIFRRLADHGVCCPAGGGRFYLDPEAADQYRARRRRRALLALLFSLAAMLVFYFAFRR